MSGSDSLESVSSDSQAGLEPVFPIYLDVEMLTGFLATLEGGFSLASNVSSTEGSTRASGNAGSISTGTSGLLGQLFQLDFSGGIQGGTSADERKEIKFVLQHTEVSLFNRLRGQLYDLDMVETIDDETKALPKLGSIVEFEGVIQSNPLTQVLRIFGPIMSLIEDESPPLSKKGQRIIQSG